MEFKQIMERINNWDNFFDYLGEWTTTCDGVYSVRFIRTCFDRIRMEYYIKNILKLQTIQINSEEIVVWFDDDGLLLFKNESPEELLFDIIFYAKSF